MESRENMLGRMGAMVWGSGAEGSVCFVSLEECRSCI